MTEEELDELALAIGGTPVDILSKYANGVKILTGSGIIVTILADASDFEVLEAVK